MAAALRQPSAARPCRGAPPRMERRTVPAPRPPPSPVSAPAAFGGQPPDPAPRGPRELRQALKPPPGERRSGLEAVEQSDLERMCVDLRAAPNLLLTALPQASTASGTRARRRLCRPAPRPARASTAAPGGPGTRPAGRTLGRRRPPPGPPRARPPPGAGPHSGRGRAWPRCAAPPARPVLYGRLVTPASGQ